MATPKWTKTSENSTGATTHTQTFDVDKKPLAGEFVISCIQMDKADAAAVNAPTSTGQTTAWAAPIVHVAGSSTDGVRHAISWKVADGGEPDVIWTWTTSRPVSCGTIIYEGSTVNAGKDTHLTGNTGTAVANSLAIGPTAAATESALGIAVWTADSSSTAPFSSMTGGYATRLQFNPITTGIPPLYIGDKTTAAGSTDSSTLSVGGSGDQLAGALLLFIGTNGGPETPPLTRHSRVGVPTDTSFDVVGKFELATTARLKVSTTQDLATTPVYSPWVTVTNNRAKATITGLTPNTLYYYGWEVDTAGTLTASGRGQAKTAQTGAHSFSFVAASCALTNTDSPVFTRMRARNPFMFVMTGDMHYQDTNSTDINLYRANWDNCMNSAVQKTMYQEVPTEHVWSDHDCVGNDGYNDLTLFPGLPYACQAWRECLPHRQLAVATDTEGLYRTFEVGRVRFIYIDCRRYRSSYLDAETVLGPTQKQWLKDLVIQNAYTKIQPKFWIMDPPWSGSALTGQDTWRSSDAERQELVNFFNTNGVKNMMIIAGDDHMCAFSDGTSTPGNIPVVQAASVDGTSSIKSSGYLYGPHPSAAGVAGTRQYSHIQVIDNGGPTVTVIANAYDVNDTRILPELRLGLTVGTSIKPDAILAQTNDTATLAEMQRDADYNDPAWT